LHKILATLSHHPTASVPLASRTSSEAQGIYRFWSNSTVMPETILQGHIDRTVVRAQRYQTVLSIQDSTDLDFTSHPHTEGLGYLNQTQQQGIKVHNCFAVSDSGEPLGVLHQHTWVREAPPLPKKERSAQQRRRNQPIEEKESYRWLTTLSAAEAQVAERVHLVQVADREADIFELFAHPRALNSDLLIRVKTNRRIQQEWGKLFTALAQAPVMGELTVEVRRTPDRPARLAQVQLRALQVTLEVPEHLARQRPELQPITLNALWVEEIGTPSDGGKPIRWKLLTTLPLETYAQACQYVRWYSYRWLIERFHFTLKSGCQVEALQLQHRDRLLKALATYSIVAWRLMAMTYLARLTPDVSCEVILNPEEWRLLRRRFAPKSRAKKPPTLHQAMVWMAQLGGFLARKRDGEPGLKTLWRGYTALHLMLDGARLVGKT
jgi:hypothetical protein